MNDNKPALAVLFPFILRKGEELALIATPDDPRHEILARVAAGHASQTDIDALADLPVFDDECVNPANACLFVVERIGRFKL